MMSLGDPRASNPVLSALQIRLQDKIIAVRENATADSNFIITHLLKQVLHEKNRVCLVNFHNPFEHYQNIGKKLGYDLAQAAEHDEIRIIEPISEIVDDIGMDQRYFREDKESIVKCLYQDIKKNLDDLLDGHKTVYLMVDDLSHLHDLGIEHAQIMSFVHYCLNLCRDDNVTVVLNNHVASKSDEVISNNMDYLADVSIEVSALRTGESHDVTGLMSVRRRSQKSEYQFKAYDRGIKTFHPGESIYYLCK